MKKLTKEKFKKVYGIEPTDKMLEEANRYNPTPAFGKEERKGRGLKTDNKYVKL